MIKLDERLNTIAECTRNNTFFYDIGTDHGYLPVFLVQSGKTERAVAADIAPFPLSKAESVIKENQLQDKIKTVLCDGLAKIELEFPCDIAIAGMGGDTICSIIDEKPELKNQAARLILQPMTKQYELRKYLVKSGFEITEEHLAKDGKIYQIICAAWDGRKRDVPDEELFLGRPCGVHKNEYLEGRKRTLLTVTEGKKKAGLDCSFEEKILNRIEELLK